MLNFTVQDLLGSALAFLIFPFVSLIPGYVVGWALDLFEFRSRLRSTRYIIGIVLSNAILPIILYLVYRFTSISFLLATLLITTGVFIFLDIVPWIKEYVEQRQFASESSHLSPPKKYAFLLAIAWTVFSLLLLVNLQIGNKLYFTTVSYDYTTRIAVINAITRTGIPPINPTYFPGHPEPLTYLYYYWYIAPSIIDQIGGNFISSGQAMIAGVAWCGLCMMATTALYLRLRNTNKTPSSWMAPLIGVQLFLISGVDVVPVLLIAIRARLLLGQMIFNGGIEGWNMPIMSWLNAVTWVPNHVSAMLQCITAMLVMVISIRSTKRQQIAAIVIAGFSFASALGSSVWVTLTFAAAWLIWAVFLFISKEKRGLFWPLVATGLFGAGLSIPYIMSVVNSGGNTSGGLPIGLYIRPFILAALLFPESLQPFVNLVLLPLNYLMELGFFFIVGLYWIQHYKDKEQGEKNNSFITAEAILLSTVTIILSFVYSTAIQINDLGIRAWLLGQFVLLIWAVDIVQTWLGNYPPSSKSIIKAIGRQPKIGRALQILFVLGLLTTALEAFSTRMWPFLVDWNVTGFPNNLSPDTNLGSRTYDARLAYQYINSHLPMDAVIQNNPDVILDRPSGLYGERQVAISDRTAYGIPESTFQTIQSDVATIFTKDTTWDAIDSKCAQYSIDALVINDLDPLWKQLPMLELQRKPLYQNQYYSVLACGNFVQR